MIDTTNFTPDDWRELSRQYNLKDQTIPLEESGRLTGRGKFSHRTQAVDQRPSNVRLVEGLALLFPEGER